MTLEKDYNVLCRPGEEDPEGLGRESFCSSVSRMLHANFFIGVVTASIKPTFLSCLLRLAFNRARAIRQ